MPNPCSNGAACIQTSPTTADCACLPGYAGLVCETDIDDCTPNPCMNGGTCTDGVNSYACTCAGGYTGASCETLVAQDAGIDAGDPWDGATDAGDPWDGATDAGDPWDGGIDAGDPWDAGGDAGDPSDAGIDAGSDVDSGSDVPDAPGASRAKGCGCSIPGSPSRGPGVATALLVGLLYVGLRRRRASR